MIACYNLIHLVGIQLLGDGRELRGPREGKRSTGQFLLIGNRPAGQVYIQQYTFFVWGGKMQLCDIRGPREGREALLPLPRLGGAPDLSEESLLAGLGLHVALRHVALYHIVSY